jgi:hypothetical protein
MLKKFIIIIVGGIYPRFPNRGVLRHFGTSFFIFPNSEHRQEETLQPISPETIVWEAYGSFLFDLDSRARWVSLATKEN